MNKLTEEQILQILDTELVKTLFKYRELLENIKNNKKLKEIITNNTI